LFLAGCHRSVDSENRRKLAGTWIATGTYAEGGDFKSSMTIDSNGNYVCDLLVQRHSGTRTFQIRGIMVISNGMVVDTMTQHSNTNATNLPIIFRERLVRFTEGELVINCDGQEGPTNDVVFRRKTK
jgi:hypothetical protein